MPNASLDLTPRFERHSEIDANVEAVFLETVKPGGWVNIETGWDDHLVAWTPWEDAGILHTTSFNQNEQEMVQSRVQKGDGGINIGLPEKWAGREVLILVLDETI